ncbi:MAG: Gfo/Idh/MocA family oxidoreductase [Planctomycetaceae bacterium]|nr:Gfo/Idh/MocA family oxidoreductase [Planctomycetaceae bacterium]
MPHDSAQRGTSRRRFLATTSGLAAAGALGPHWFATTRQALGNEEPRSKNDRLVFGAIGLGGQGTHIANNAARFGDIVAVCDVDRERAEKAKAHFGGKADIFEDYRKLVERPDINAVTIGTPDHWHTAVCLAALRAGKDVYCEKPLTLTIDEGKLLIKTVAETGRVFQVGTQQRSDDRFRLACELVRNGRIGKLKHVTVTLPDSPAGGPFAKQPVPPNLNWDFWLGQAPAVDYIPERCHYQFRWWYEYSGGIMTDWGAHHMDIAHWGMGIEDSGPLTIEGKGKLPNIVDGYNTPNLFTVDFTYPNDVTLHVNIGDNGVLFEGDKSRVYVNRGRIAGKPVEDLKDNPLPEDRIKLIVSKDHMGNFVSCVKSREKPISDVVSQHRSVSACHLANISLRLGRKLTWDAQAEKFVGDSEADAMLSRAQRAPYVVA